MAYKDESERYLTRGLFKETISTHRAKTHPAVFTLKPYDDGAYKSLKKIYMEVNDPTEYLFAIEAFGEEGWEQWQKLSKAGWFQPYIESWRDELEIKMRAEGVRKMRDLANSGNKDAAKWVAEGGWDKKAAGRPSKAQIKAEAKKRAGIKDDIADDAARLGFKVSGK